jgi:hypothetical protein
MIRTVILISLIIFFACSDNGNNQGEKTHEFGGSLSGEKTAIIEFDKTECHIEKVIEGEKVGCQFSFRNSGTADLIIQNATASCGCTVPRWSREPIKPGKTGSLEVIFDSSGRMGVQKKTVTVYSNAVERVINLTIIAEIINK